MSFDDKFKQEIDGLFFQATRKLISEECHYLGEFLLRLVQSGPMSDKGEEHFYTVKDKAYEGFSLGSWSKIFRISGGYKFSLSTCSKDRIICNISPGITISLSEEMKDFEVRLKFLRRSDLCLFSSFSELPDKPVMIFFPVGLFFLALLSLNSGNLLFFGLRQGLQSEILLAIFLFHDKNFCLLKTKKISPSPVSQEKEGGNVIVLKGLDAVSLEVGRDLLSLIDPALEPNPLFKKIIEFKNYLRDMFIFTIPGVIFRDNLKLKPSEYIIKIKGYIAARGDALKDQLLVLGLDEELKAFSGPPYGPDFIYGLKGVWIERENREIAERSGCLIMDAIDVISRHLEEIISNNLYKFFGLQDTELLLDTFIATYPQEVFGIRTNLEVAEICSILRNLISDRIPLSSPQFILASLWKISTSQKDPSEIYGMLRKEMLPFIFTLYRDITGGCFYVSSSLERILLKFSRKTKIGYELYLPLNLREKIFKSSLRLVYRHEFKNSVILLCSPEIRPLLTIVLRESFPQIRVFSVDELPSEFSLSVEGEFDI